MTLSQYTDNRTLRTTASDAEDQRAHRPKDSFTPYPNTARTSNLQAGNDRIEIENTLAPNFVHSRSLPSNSDQLKSVYLQPQYQHRAILSLQNQHLVVRIKQEALSSLYGVQSRLS